MNKWDGIRAFYAKWQDEIMRSRNAWAAGDAYLWDHEGKIQLTPIENWLWSDIRAVGAVLYPQYPVGGFFVDFGNPVAKVAIECDGAAYHLDKEKDSRRDARLVQLGWAVYRISGSTCRTETDHEAGTVNEAVKAVREIAERHRIVLGKA